MLEIHVLRGRPMGAAFDRCLASVKSTGAAIRIIENEGKTISAGREQAYEECEAQFVSFVDDDDTSLLTPSEVFRLCSMDKPALFTNGVTVFRGDKSPCVPPSVTQWTLDQERRQIVRPHPTIIYRASVARLLMRESLRLIAANGWHANTFDYVMRCVASITIGWHYDAAKTYQWNIGHDSHHQVNAAQFYPLRGYFFRAGKWH
jgi:hypothetical protein